MPPLDQRPDPIAPAPPVEVLAPVDARAATILTPAALEFVAGLERAFRARRRELLERRERLKLELDAGWRPGFLPETSALRAAAWRVAETRPDLCDRRVEITGPVDRKMIINALTSGANVFMADFEDATAPTWRNVVEGQANLHEAVRRKLRFVAPDSGRVYALPGGPMATLVVRPRGWHLHEKHVLVDGQPVSASIFDFGLYVFHNAVELVRRGTGPYLYLPKLEGHLEARLWNDVFVDAQARLDLPRGTIRATVLIETILAAFEMDEILFELREHSSGLNCGRWDYIFSYAKKLRADATCVLPDRGGVTMEQPFLRAYSQLLVRTCHRRGAHAMGGMAAQIPIKDDAERNRVALERVRADKRREAQDGHDGTWVAHPGLIALAREEFDRAMPGLHQMGRLREDVRVGAADLLAAPTGRITEAGLRVDLDVSLRYLEAWLGGQGCVPIHGLMEDAATAEISRTQVWQWLRHRARLEDGRTVDEGFVRATLDDVAARLRAEVGEERFATGRYALARSLLIELYTQRELADFLTLRAYEHI
jgi:malate synthase